MQISDEQIKQAAEEIADYEERSFGKISPGYAGPSKPAEIRAISEILRRILVPPAEPGAPAPEPGLPMIDGVRPRLRKIDGHPAWVIDDGDSRGQRLCGDGRWRSYYHVRNSDVCSWPTEAAAIAFLHDLAPEPGLPMRPRIVCLCGSGRFKEAFDQAEFDETLSGKIVLTIGCNTKDIARTPDLEHRKPMLDELHKRKIDIADEVLVLDVGGYIGSSTRSEIEYAAKHGKPIRYLSHDLAKRGQG